MDKLRSLEYFIKVAEAKSIVAAANLLDVSPSAVSRVVARLEAQLGFVLFHRTTRRMSLTANGEAFLERCRQILQDLEDAEGGIGQDPTAPRGVVKVGLHPAFRNPFFSEIARFLERYPTLTIEHKISNSPSLLFDEGFDLLIRAGDLGDSNLVAQCIGHLGLVVGASPAYLRKHGEPKTPEDLKRHRWVLPRRVDNVLGWSPRFQFLKGGQRRVINVSSYVTSHDSIGTSEAVIAGAGISCLYTVAFMRPVRDGLVKPLLTDWIVPGRPAFAIFPSRRAITRKGVAVVELFKALVAEAEAAFPLASAVVE